MAQLHEKEKQQKSHESANPYAYGISTFQELKDQNRKEFEARKAEKKLKKEAEVKNVIQEVDKISKPAGANITQSAQANKTQGAKDLLSKNATLTKNQTSLNSKASNTSSSAQVTTAKNTATKISQAKAPEQAKK